MNDGNALCQREDGGKGAMEGMFQNFYFEAFTKKHRQPTSMKLKSIHIFQRRKDTFFFFSFYLFIKLCFPLFNLTFL